MTVKSDSSPVQNYDADEAYLCSCSKKMTCSVEPTRRAAICLVSKTYKRLSKKRRSESLSVMLHPMHFFPVVLLASLINSLHFIIQVFP